VRTHTHIDTYRARIQGEIAVQEGVPAAAAAAATTATTAAAAAVSDCVWRGQSLSSYKRLNVKEMQCNRKDCRGGLDMCCLHLLTGSLLMSSPSSSACALAAMRYRQYALMP
jgi:hypothetical protein